jgi:hypothetical protein
MGSNHFEIGQACKKALESARLSPEKAVAELLGAINYLAAAVILREREHEREKEVKETTSSTTVFHALK